MRVTAAPAGANSRCAMLGEPLVLYEEEFAEITRACGWLQQAAGARAVFLIDRNGQLLASAGSVGHLDVTSLASLAAGNVAATNALAQLVGEEHFFGQLHEGRTFNLNLSVVGERMILVVVFDRQTSIGLVRLRVRTATDELGRIFERARERGASEASAFPQITDEDIDNLFND